MNVSPLWSTPRPGKRSVAVAGQPEARSWLEDNPHPLGFGCNTFREIENAEQYVENLYALGAERIVIDNIHVRSSEAGPFADTLHVTLPADALKRTALVRYIQSHDAPDELHRVRDGARVIGPTDRPRYPSVTVDKLKGGDVLRLWWD